MRNTDHVVISTQTGAFECLHCGASYKPTLPAPINMVVAMSNQFVKDHADCKPQTGETLMKRFEPGTPL